MDGGERLFATFIVCVTAAVLTLIGWGMYRSRNTHNFEVHCLDVGKTIQWRTLEGQNYAYRECK